MTNILKATTTYTVVNESDILKADGSFTSDNISLLRDLYLNFTVDNVFVGGVNYSETETDTSINYNIINKDYKELIIAQTDLIIKEIKEQLV